jgi:hypothetical protein
MNAFNLPVCKGNKCTLARLQLLDSIIRGHRHLNSCKLKHTCKKSDSVGLEAEVPTPPEMVVVVSVCATNLIKFKENTCNIVSLNNFVKKLDSHIYIFDYTDCIININILIYIWVKSDLQP